ncbi:MAG TPA: hypothetical protein VN937_24640, partial [Blastocatellia bacterium]|nr:hypothetical protein [Blastocatellia bacterium]
RYSARTDTQREQILSENRYSARTDTQREQILSENRYSARTDTQRKDAKDRKELKEILPA